MSSIPFTPGDKVFGYGRDSGGEEQDLSVAQQEEALRRWCQENGLVLTRFFKDEARRGSSTVGRANLQSMMHEFRRGCHERGVIVWKYNRFARSVDNAQFLRAEIRTLGYIFHSITDNVPEGPMGRLFEAAIDFKDEQFLIDLSLDTKRGLRELVEKYGCLPGGTPTGFIRVPVTIGTRRDGTPHIAHRWKPDPAMTKRILKAFQMRARKASLAEIHKQTKVMGAINSYRTFFSNPIYKGVLRFGDYIKEDYCKPIVPADLWDKVQEVQSQYTRRKSTSSTGTDNPRRANSRFLLSGLSNHQLCGSPLFGHGSKQPSGKYYDSYFCARAFRKRDCVKQRIPRETFENAVVNALSDQILTPGYFQAVFEDLQRGQAGRMQAQTERRKEITDDLTRVHKQIRNVIDAIANRSKKNQKSKALDEKLTELELEENKLESDLADLDATAETPVPQLDPVLINALAHDFKRIYEKSDLSIRRMIIRGIIDHVDVVREDNMLRGIIFFYYPPDPPFPKVDGPGDNVPTVRHPSGPPRCRHIVSFPFEVPIRKSR